MRLQSFIILLVMGVALSTGGGMLCAQVRVNDNLGNHTATKNLNVNKFSVDSVGVLNYYASDTIPDKATGGDIGTAAATVDKYTAFRVKQTTINQALTLPMPTLKTLGRKAYVKNTGETSFTMYGVTVAPGSIVELFYNGSSWGGYNPSPIVVLKSNSLVSTALGAGRNASGGLLTAHNGVYLGPSAGNLTDDLWDAIFIGQGAGNNATHAHRTVALGYQAGANSTNASDAIFFGHMAGQAAYNANNSVFIGTSAGCNADTARYSVFLGNAAGGGAINASYSFLMGYGVGREYTNGGQGHIGQNNIIIGNNISLPAGTTNAINLGGVLFGTGTYFNPTVPLPSILPVSGGRIGIGTSSPAATLDVKGQVNITQAGGGAGYVGLRAPMGTMTGYSLILPKAPGTAGQVLGVASVAGVVDSLSWTDASLFSIPINKLVAATGTNSINNDNYGQTWQWNGLTTGKGLSLESTSIAAAGNTQTLFNVALSGANATASQTTYGAQISNTHTGAGTNVGLNVSASGGTNNYALLVPNGNVGIGTTSPQRKLDITNGAGRDASAAIISGDENNNAILYLGTPSGGDVSIAMKTAIIAQGTGGWSRAKLHFALNDQAAATGIPDGNVTTYTAGVSDAKMTIQSNGYVGIGTTSPSNSLSFGGNTYRVIGVERNNTKDASGTVTGGSGQDLYIEAGGATAGKTNYNGGNLILKSGQTTGKGSSNIYFSTYDATPASGSDNSNDRPSSAKMTILGNGNVGIGSTTLAAKLSIKSPSDAFPATTGTEPKGLIVRMEAADNGVLDIGNVGGGTAWLQSTDKGHLDSTYPLLLNPNGGNVGIGTTAPAAKLDVKGQVNITQTGSNTGYVGLVAPAANLSSYTLTLPTSGGSSGQVLTTSGGNAPTLTWATPAASGLTAASALTKGSVLFAGDNGVVAQNNSQLVWDDAHKMFGIGAAPAARLDITNNLSDFATSTQIDALHVNCSGPTDMDNTAAFFSNKATINNFSDSKLKYGVYIESTGPWGVRGAYNTGLLVNVSGAEVNNAAIFRGGNVGIGTPVGNCPAYTLDVVGTANVSGVLSTSGYSFPEGTPGTGQVMTATDGTHLGWATPVTYTAGTGISITGTIVPLTINNTGVLSITGTSNQVNVNSTPTGGTGAVTLSLPQDIGTGSSPTFANLTVNGNINAPSDIRLKTHVETLTDVLAKIENLRGVRYEFIDQKKYATGPQIGVIAQELQKEFPELVVTKPDGYLAVNYTQLTAILIQAVKEQQQEIKSMKETLDVHSKQMETMMKMIQELKGEK